MNSNYFNSKKYIILLIVICALLAILTAKVFEYMPQEVNDGLQGYNPQTYQKNLSTPADEQFNSDSNTIQSDSSENDAYDNEDEDEDEDEETDDNNTTDYINNDEQHKSGHIDFMPPADNKMDFEEIEAPEGTIEHIIYATH